MDDSYKCIILRKTTLFKNLQPEVLLQSAQEASVLEVEKDTTLFKQGDPSEGFYILVAGEIEIVLEPKMIILAHLKEYDFFGELGLLDNSVRTSSAIAKTDCTLLYFSKDTFESLILDVPEILLSLAQIITNYVRQNLEIATFGGT